MICSQNNYIPIPRWALVCQFYTDTSTTEKECVPWRSVGAIKKTDHPCTYRRDYYSSVIPGMYPCGSNISISASFSALHVCRMIRHVVRKTMKLTKCGMSSLINSSRFHGKALCIHIFIILITYVGTWPYFRDTFSEYQQLCCCYC